MKSRVLIVAHGSGAYGANQSLLNIVSALSSKGIFVLIVIPSKGEICEKFDSFGFNYKIVKYSSELCHNSKSLYLIIFNLLRSYKRKIVNFFALIKLKNLLIENSINIIHSNSAVVKIGFDLAVKNQIPHIWHLREYIHPNYDLYVFGGFNKYKKKIQTSTKIIAISNGVANRFDVFNNSMIIRDAVRKSPKYNTRPVKEKYFLFCGALHKNKGIEEAILAYYHVFGLYKDYKLIVVGTGEVEYEIYLKNKVDKLKMSSHVLFFGFRNDIDDLMYKATAFLMCSRNEALGRVTIEAMLNFCLVIGYNDSGTSEIIENNKTGCLYDSINELVLLMLKSIENFEYFDDIINAAYLHAKLHYLEDKYGNDLIDFYNKIEISDSFVFKLN